MSNTARKARKKAGIPFVRQPKVGTPPEERSVPWLQTKQGMKPSGRAVRRLKRLYGPADGSN